jgi:hypothetical protein
MVSFAEPAEPGDSLMRSTKSNSHCKATASLGSVPPTFPHPPHALGSPTEGIDLGRVDPNPSHPTPREEAGAQQRPCEELCDSRLVCKHHHGRCDARGVRVELNHAAHEEEHGRLGSDDPL